MELTPEMESEMSGDHESPHVNLTMPAVSKREYSGSIFKAEKRDWPAVQRLAAQFRAETDQGSNPGEFGEAGHIWLIASTESPRANYILAAGAAQIEQTSNGWILAWWWIHPIERGRGLARKFWKGLESNYGDFWLELPIATKAMTQFIATHDPDGNHKLGQRH